MKIGIIVAMESEYAQILGLLGGKPEGRIGNNDIVLRRSGMGKVNAAVGAVSLIGECAPDCIISTGVAGGLQPGQKVMDVVVSSEIVYHDVWCGEGNAWGQVQGLPERFSASPALLKCARALECGVHAGLICSGDQFIDTKEQEEVILGHFPEGIAVDMESGSLAQVCHLKGVPFISFRILSDVPDAEGHQQVYDNFWKTVGDTSFNTVKAFLTSLPGTLR